MPKAKMLPKRGGYQGRPFPTKWHTFGDMSFERLIELLELLEPQWSAGKVGNVVVSGNARRPVATEALLVCLFVSAHPYLVARFANPAELTRLMRPRTSGH